MCPNDNFDVPYTDMMGTNDASVVPCADMVGPNETFGCNLQ